MGAGTLIIVNKPSSAMPRTIKSPQTGGSLELNDKFGGSIPSSQSVGDRPKAGTRSSQPPGGGNTRPRILARSLCRRQSDAGPVGPLLKEKVLSAPWL